MMVTAELDLDQFAQDADSGLVINLDIFGYFYSHGYPVEDIVEAYNVIHSKTDNADTGHVVVKIETLSKPLDEADVAADSHTMYACDCKAYMHHHSVDLEEKYITAWESCKHIEAVAPSKKAMNDPQQTEL